MSEWVPHIYKGKVGKNWRFVLKYSDLESCFVNTSGKTVYLDVGFYCPHSSPMHYRDRLAVAGYWRLVTIQFNPMRPTHAFYWEPSRNERSTFVVNASVYALPNELARRIGISRRLLRWLMTREFREIAAQGLFTSMWHFQANLHARIDKVECAWQVRKGAKLVRGKSLSIDVKPNKLLARHRWIGFRRSRTRMQKEVSPDESELGPYF